MLLYLDPGSGSFLLQSPLQKPFLPQRVQRSTKFFETIVRQNSKLLIEPFRNPLYTSCPLWFRPFCSRVFTTFDCWTGRVEHFSRLAMGESKETL